MSAEPIDVLLVEDNPADARLLIETLKESGTHAFRVTTAPRLRAAVELLAVHRPQVVLLDLSLPDSQGLESIPRVQAAAPGVPIVVLTGLQDEAVALRALRQGVQDYLVKGQSEGGLAARALRYAVERQRIEDALRDGMARLAAVVNTAVDAIITIDERGVIESVNPAALRLFGYTSDELMGRNVSVIMPDPYRAEHDAYLERYLRTGAAKIIGIGREVVGLRKDGSTLPLDLSVSEFRIGGRRMFTGILHDASNRRRLEREILEASANEQRRVGHELHDGLCQQLTGAAFAAEILARRLKDEAPGSLPLAQRLGEEIDQAITQARALARGLNPVEVHAGGLAAALEDLSRKVSETFQVTCEFLQDAGASIGDNAAETHLYRIAQEAISNAIRHGKAKRVQVALRCRDNLIVLSVSDDGEGFAANGYASGAGGKSDGIGLHTMAYRAKMIGGILEIRPGPRRGVVVSCAIPRKRAYAGDAR